MYKTFRTVNRMTNGEIAERNRAVRAYKSAVAQNDRLDAVVESSWQTKQDNIERNAKAIVPNVVNRLCKEYREVMPEIVLREYFTRLVTESLIWDPEAVTERQESIRYMAHKYISAIGGLKAVKEAAIKNKSAYLESLYNICMEAGKKIADKKAKKTKASVTADNVKNQTIDFSVDEEDEKELDKKINNLGVDELSDLVKEKVLQVVKDESDAQKNDDEFIAELKEAVKDAKEGEINPREINNGGESSDSGTSTSGGESAGGAEGGTAAAESFAPYAQGGLHIQRSLFRSMFARSTKSAIRESAENNDALDNAGKDPLKQTIANAPQVLNIYDIYLTDRNEDLGYIDYVKNSDDEAIAGDEKRIDNDMLLAEAIGMYTMLECASTIKLISPTINDIKRVVAHNYKA